MDLRLLLIATLSAVLWGSWAQQGKNKDMSEMRLGFALFILAVKY